MGTYLCPSYMGKFFLGNLLSAAESSLTSARVRRQSARMASRTPKKPQAPALASEAVTEDAPPPARVKLGCAPLIIGIILVALLGKFLPHDLGRAPPSSEPAEPKAQAKRVQVKPSPVEPNPVKPMAVQQQSAEAPRRPDAPPKPAPPSAAKSSPSAAAPKQAFPALSSKAAVANNPWNGSVRQVERYLKNSLYDAASFEAIEWSRVAETKRGFRVSCKYRSKNVLGVYVTQSKTFFLDKAGEIYAVKE